MVMVSLESVMFTDTSRQQDSQYSALWCMCAYVYLTHSIVIPSNNENYEKVQIMKIIQTWIDSNAHRMAFCYNDIVFARDNSISHLCSQHAAPDSAVLLSSSPRDVAAEAPHLSELTELVRSSAANLLIGEVVQSRRRPLLGPSPGWKRLLPLSHLRHY